MMRTLPRILRSRFLRKDDGATIIEFALVAPLFFLLFFGIIEFGLFMYHKIAIERIAVEVSRAASIGKTSDSSCATTTVLTYIECMIRVKSAGLINGNRIQMQINTLASGGNQVPDICLDDPNNPSSTVPKAECVKFEDVNNDGDYDPLGASNEGLPEEVMQITITYPWTVLFPLLNQFFGSATNKGVVMVAASTVIKNEPE